MQAGVLAGYPVVDVKVHLTFGSYHEVDSSEMAFKIAAPWRSRSLPQGGRHPAGARDEGFRHRTRRVSGNVIGDLTSRRGMIQGQESRPGATQVDALVPLASMFATPLTYAPPPRPRPVLHGAHSYVEIPRASPRRLSRSGAARTINFCPLAFLATRVLHFILQCYTIFSHYCGNKNHLTIRI